jgi:hypothetical protein
MAARSIISAAVAFALVGLAAACAQELSAKRAVPDDAAQKQAVELVREVYKTDYESARSPEAKAALASGAEKGDPTTLGGTGAPVAGVAGREGANCDAFGWC